MYRSQINIKLANFFLKSGITTFRDAILYIHSLPYKHTSNRENYFQVLKEGQGVCSTQYALIAKLAEELSIPLKLTLGLFFITAENTPEVTDILQKYQLKSIPEAHSYIKYNNHILDMTFSHMPQFSFNGIIEQEIDIIPEQIGFFKMEKHKTFIMEWLKDKRDVNFDLIWTAREEWISKLMQNN